MGKSYQKLTIKELKNRGAEYNPRKITREQLKRLKKSIEQLGDLSGVVYNRRTGRVVGGHQRLKVIPDSAEIEITERYKEPTETGTVAIGFIVINGEKYAYREVDWDESTEKTANIAANAHGGDWDEEKLAEIMKELSAIDSIDFDLTGFSMADVYQILGEAPEHSKAEQLEVIAEQLRKAREVMNELTKNLEEVGDVPDSYLVVVFKDYKARKEFTNKLGLPDNRYVDGRELMKYLKD